MNFLSWWIRSCTDFNKIVFCSLHCYPGFICASSPDEFCSKKPTKLPFQMYCSNKYWISNTFFEFWCLGVSVVEGFPWCSTFFWIISNFEIHFKCTFFVIRSNSKVFNRKVPIFSWYWHVNIIQKCQPQRMIRLLKDWFPRPKCWKQRSAKLPLKASKPADIGVSS